MNQTKCALTITMNENQYTHVRDFSTEVVLIDYNLDHPSYANDLNLIVFPTKKKNDMKKDEISLVLLERKEASLMEKLKEGPQQIKNIACELVIGTSQKTGKDYYGVLVNFTEDHHKMYFLSSSNLKTLKMRDLKANFERRADINIDDDIANEEEEA